MFDHPDDAGGRHRGHSSSSDAVDIRSPDWSAVDAMELLCETREQEQEQLRANDDDPRDDSSIDEIMPKGMPGDEYMWRLTYDEIGIINQGLCYIE